jgi:hypothetical protein
MNELEGGDETRRDEGEEVKVLMADEVNDELIHRGMDRGSE